MAAVQVDGDDRAPDRVEEGAEPVRQVLLGAGDICAHGVLRGCSGACLAGCVGKLDQHLVGSVKAARVAGVMAAWPAHSGSFGTAATRRRV